MLLGQQAPQPFPALVHRPAENDAIGARKVDMLEDTKAALLWGSETNRFDSAARYAHHLARLDFANVFRIDQIERAGFRRQHPRPIQLPQAQRTKTARITYRVEFVDG